MSAKGQKRANPPLTLFQIAPDIGLSRLCVWEPTMLKLYGNALSRAMRCLWMLEEMGEPYQLIEKSTRAEDLQSADYLRLNPNALIPTLVDGDVVLWESMAINLYLAQKYDGPMHCDARVLGLA